MFAQGLLVLLCVSGAGEAPPPTATPVSTRPRTLADVARENRLRGEKKTGTFSVAGGGEVAPLPGEPAATKASGSRRPSSSPAVPAGGGDEGYWRGRAERLREEVENARRMESAEATRLREVLTKARNSEQLPQFAEEIRRRQGACRLRVESAQKQLEALPEEARKAGANPGWVR